MPLAFAQTGLKFAKFPLKNSKNPCLFLIPYALTDLIRFDAPFALVGLEVLRVSSKHLSRKLLALNCNRKSFSFCVCLYDLPLALCCLPQQQLSGLVPLRCRW
uniref:(northern house mosquito) hypothetical protein n=1 Tax=Culex pipiens TaxID=7175 RepID=A0A8D8HXT9_CULPI